MHERTLPLALKALLLLPLVLGACESAQAPTPTASLAPIPTAALQATREPEVLVPVNPLSGLEVEDPRLLDTPVVLISISHFPATARPQAGLSFAPFVYEFSITEGATRFLAAFYGEWPEPEIAMPGGCPPRLEPAAVSGTLIGNRVWLDSDGDGIQDAGEKGVSGLCVNLYNERGEGVAQTTTDTAGFFGFDVANGRYWIEFVQPEHLTFTHPDAGDETRDSDADPSTGRVEIVAEGTNLDLDAGMIASGVPPAASTPLAAAQVGPIRSGRMVYRHLAGSYQDSCLIFASASPEVLAHLPHCELVLHELSGGGYMMGLDELWSVARENQRRSKAQLDYTGYEFSDSPPPGGTPAAALELFIAYQNQSGWYYDPPSSSYLRFVDTSAREQAGILHPDFDRLTGRQLRVQNVIVVFAKHRVITPTNLDIMLDPGRTGKAILFRDGMTFNIDWSTVAEKPGVTDRPMKFLQKDGEPVPLRAGHTWVIIVTPESTVQEESAGRWQLTFFPPPGSQ